MKIKTRDFGEITIDERDIITFRQPVYGFEDLKEYVFLYDEELSGQFVWLQSVEIPEICFILVDPAAVMQHYEPDLPKETVELLGGEEEKVMCWLVAVIPEEFKNTTVNLKSPIVVNPRLKCGLQVILEDNLPIRYPLFKDGKENGKC